MGRFYNDKEGEIIMAKPLTKVKLLEKASAKPLTKEDIVTLTQYVGLSAPEKIDIVTIEKLKSALEYYIKRISNDKAWIESDDTIMEFSINQLKKAFPAIYENAGDTKRLKSERDEISRSNEIKYEK